VRKPVLPRRVLRRPCSRPLSIKRIVAPEILSRAEDNPDGACGSNPSVSHDDNLDNLDDNDDNDPNADPG
jgi:hypothetical protein